MPTINDWINALQEDREFTITSSNALIRDIQSKQLMRSQDLISRGKTPPPMKNNLVPISAFNPFITVNIKPIYLLHAIGRITTPPVPNLADLSSTWAIIRYLWAFDVSNGVSSQPLILSDIARSIDFHQKALISDEVGMGMAYYVMTNFLNTTDVIDVSLALNTMPISLRYSSSPDYLFIDDLNNKVFVVECKGNQTSRAAAMDQLRRGTEQVPSVFFSDGTQAEALVIATCMLDNNTTVYVIDPPDEIDYEHSDFDNDGKAEKIGPNQWRIADDESFWQNSRLFSRAKKLSYSGTDFEALNQLPLHFQDTWVKYARRQRQIERLRTSFGYFTGVLDSLSNPEGYRITLYRGILEELRERYLLSPLNEKERAEKGREKILASKEFTSQFEEHAYLSEFEVTNTSLSSRSVSRDGTLFQMTITE